MKRLFAVLLTVMLLAALLPAGVAEKELTVVTLALNHSAYTETNHWENANEMKLLREKYGIDLQFKYYDDQQYPVLYELNPEDMPDIMTCSDQYLAAVVDTGKAVDIGEYLDKYPNINSDLYKASNDLSKILMGGPEQKLYFLTPSIGPEALNADDDTSWGFRVRWDLYKQLGCPEIKNEDDFIQLIEDMVALYPVTESGEKVWGIGTWNAFSRWYQSGCLILEGGGLNPWIWGGTMYMTSWKDTTLYNGYTDFEHSAYWTAMRYFNKLWNKGLLDPDSFIMTGPELQAKMAAGRYVAAVPYEGRQLYNTRREEDPDTLTGIVSLGSAATFQFANKLAVIGNSPSDNIFINAKSKNIEAALQVIDFFRDPEIIRTHLNGIKGVDWDVDENGVPYLTEKALADIEKYGRGTLDYIEATGIHGYITEWTPFMATGIAPDGYPFDLSQMFKYRAQVLKPLQKDFAEHYGVSCPSEYYMQLVNDGTTIDISGDYGQMVAAGIAAVPSDIKRIMDECSQICQNAMPELVMAETAEEYAEVQQQVLKDLEAAGEAEAWAWCEENFNTVKAQMQPIFEEAKANFKDRVAE